MGTFNLMNGDNRIARVECEGNYVGIVQIYNDNMNLSYIRNVKDWFQCRMTPFGRRNIQQLLDIAKIHDIENYLKITKAISLNDTLWVDDCSNPTTWNKVNPYMNSLSRVISEIALMYNYNGGNVKSPSPEYQTDGAFAKCWKRIDGEICLIKGGSEKLGDSTGNEPYSEVLVCQVAKVMKLNEYTRYSVKEDYKKQAGDLGTRAFSICKSFTSENIGYIPIEVTKYRNLEMVDLYKTFNNPKDSRRLLEMLLLDSIVLNSDRHMGNFGFLINNEHRNIISLAPIFDNNYALLPRLSIRDREREEILADVKSCFPKTMECTFIEQGKTTLRLDNSLRNNVKNLLDFEFDISGMKYFSKERANFLSSLVRFQARKILEC